MAKKSFKISNSKFNAKIIDGFVMYLFGDDSILSEDEIIEIADEIQALKFSDEDFVTKLI